MDPDPVSWMAPRGTDDFRRLLEFDPTWRDDARRFEFITLPFQDFAALNASLELFFELGPGRAAAHATGLAEEIITLNAGRRDIEILSPRDPVQRSALVSLRPRDGQKVSDALKAAGVVHSLRENAIRLSPHFYNTSAEVRRALEIFWGAL